MLLGSVIPARATHLSKSGQDDAGVGWLRRTDRNCSDGSDETVRVAVLVAERARSCDGCAGGVRGVADGDNGELLGQVVDCGEVGFRVATVDVDDSRGCTAIA